MSNKMKYFTQLKSVLRHKYYVFIAGRLLGVPLWRLVVHDWSKFTPTELFGYAGNIGGKTNKNKWAKAWLHHLHHNPHHPEHWVLTWRGNPNFYDDIGEYVADFVRVIPMPEIYVREMVADSLATGYTVTKSWDISNWLNANGPDMILHSHSLKLFNDIMEESGFYLKNGNWSWEMNILL